MFSKAKLKRFNEEVGCAPPPTAYNPKVKEKSSVALTLSRSDRWKCATEVTPGPGAYTTENKSPVKKPSSSCRLNSSSISNASSASGSGMFLSPLKLKTPSQLSSTWAVHGQSKGDSRVAELQEQIKELIKERGRMKSSISQLETELEVLKSISGRRELTDNTTSTNAEEFDLERNKRERCESNLRLTTRSTPKNDEKLKSHSTACSAQNEESHPNKDCTEQLQSTKTALIEAQQLVSSLTDERSGLQLKLKQLEESAEKKSFSEDELQSMKEQIQHLTLLRDNLEAAAFQKDDLIAELQVQLDELVIEGRGYQNQMEENKSRLEQLQEEIEISFKERNETENKVRSLVAKYEALMKDQLEEREMNMEILAKKDIEIELLNGSLNNLNMRVAEYEQTLFSLQEEASQRCHKISQLETTVSDLSLISKEKEVMESMLEEELGHRTEEVRKLEETVQDIKGKLHEAKHEKICTAAMLEAEQKKNFELEEQIHQLEMELKEKEVVQQFLEKEITSREAEISDTSAKVKELESDLETARQVALDLQQEAETQLNEVLTLKTTIAAKDFDISSKGEIITTLQEEISGKVSETSILQEKVEKQSSATANLEKQLMKKEEQITNLNKELTSLNTTVSVCEEKIAGMEVKISNLEDNNHQLEEKIVDLMAEISDREAHHISRVNHLESDLDDLGIKYSEALLEHEATRRVLTQTSEQLDKENLLRMASEADIKNLKEEVATYQEENKTMESNLKDLVQKYTNLEDALACEEAENRDLEDKLERELRLAEETAAVTQKELSTLQTSNAGFCTQITQLKIDMRKKSQAVEEMQLCIETLREEKVHLTTLRDNLERSVETKEETIAQLHLKTSTLEREMEEERVTLRSRIADLENHLKETEYDLISHKKSITELEDKVSALEEDKLKLNKSYEKQLEEKASLLTQVTTELEEVEKKYDGYEDQLKNLQTSLLEKTAEAGDIEERYRAVSRTLESNKEEMNTLEACVSKLKFDVSSVNKTLRSKESMVESLNATVSTKSEEMQSLYKRLEEKQGAIVEYESRLLKLEENEEKLVKEKEEATLKISNLQDTLSLTKSQLSRLEVTYSKEKTAEVSRITQVFEADSAALLEELNSWKNKFQYLEKMIEPFREQLDAYEIQRASLLERSSAAKEEVAKLSKQYATLLGHQNHKQKIQHVLKLKNENSELKEEVHKLREEIERQRKTIKRFEEKMLRLSGSSSRLNDTSRLMSDKENSFHVGASAPSMASTPLKSSNKPQRL